jgi:hypothetical protein
MRACAVAILAVVVSSCERTTAPSALPFSAVSVGFNHACAISSSAGAVCWGWNGSGQLGSPTAETCQGYACSSVPVAVTDGRTYVAVAAGGQHTCALNHDGAAYCWGSNAAGQLGVGALVDPSASTPRAVDGGHHFTAISAGDGHTCALTSDGTAYCWGEGSSGQLGTGAAAPPTPTPTAVSGGRRFSLVTAGSNFTCGIASDTLFCWGSNAEGQLGTGDRAARFTPTPVAPAFGARLLGAAPSAIDMCGANASGRLYCWGANVAWQLGDGTDTTRGYPVAVATSQQFQSVSTGGAFTCAVTLAGAAYCWGAKGQGDLGQLGTGSAADSPMPVPVTGGLTFRTLGSGDAFSCGLTTDGRLYCWGSGFRGALGSGSTVVAYAPVEVVVPPTP